MACHASRVAAAEQRDMAPLPSAAKGLLVLRRCQIQRGVGPGMSGESGLLAMPLCPSFVSIDSTQFPPSQPPHRVDPWFWGDVFVGGPGGDIPACSCSLVRSPVSHACLCNPLPFRRDFCFPPARSQFVLTKALAAGLRPMVVLNKVRWLAFQAAGGERRQGGA